MAITATPLTPCFAARIDGVDIARPVDDATWAEVRAAFEAHSVLVFRGPPLDDDGQIAFSRRFGGLEVTRSINPAAGTPFARQSNLDIKTGEVIPPDDRRLIYQIANMLWHSDSSVARSDPAGVLHGEGARRVPARASPGRPHEPRDRREGALSWRPRAPHAADDRIGGPRGVRATHADDARRGAHGHGRQAARVTPPGKDTT